MINKKVISFLLICILIIGFISPVLAVEDRSQISTSIPDTLKPISLSKEEINNLPNQIKLFLNKNKDATLIDTIIYHYRLEENDGEIKQDLVKTFNIKDYEGFKAFANYKNSEEAYWLSPREGRDIFLGITTYGISSSRPTAYQVQGWWEWDKAALGVFHSNWDVIGLIFYGETRGYDYSCFANGVNTGVALYPQLLDSNDNGGAFQHTTGTLSEGAILGKVISSNSNSRERFEVELYYEYFDQNPNQSYLSQLIQYLLGLRITMPPPLPSGNARLDASKFLYYGNN